MLLHTSKCWQIWTLSSGHKSGGEVFINSYISRKTYDEITDSLSDKTKLIGHIMMLQYWQIRIQNICIDPGAQIFIFILGDYRISPKHPNVQEWSVKKLFNPKFLDKWVTPFAQTFGFVQHSSNYSCIKISSSKPSIYAVYELTLVMNLVIPVSRKYQWLTTYGFNPGS